MLTPCSWCRSLYLQENKNLSPNQIKTLLSDRSTKGKVSDTQGTPNKLLYSLTDNNTTPNLSQIRNQSHNRSLTAN
ncbi:alkaline serine exoprotease A [Vibrio cholerae NCTC 8457]|nr:alkaline serine exoprotease A [Vibrio cholerae NCTC 8457]